MTVFYAVSITVYDRSGVINVSVRSVGGGGSNFLPLYSSTLLLVRVSQKVSFDKIEIKF